MELVLNYLASHCNHLRNDYRTPDGKHSASCTSIACDIAQLFLESGHQPSLLQLTGKKVADGVNNSTLVPTMFSGRVSWGAHIVCCCNDEVFDPLIGLPMALPLYLKEMFNMEIEHKVMVSPERIQEFVNR